MKRGPFDIHCAAGIDVCLRNADSVDVLRRRIPAWQHSAKPDSRAKPPLHACFVGHCSDERGLIECIGCKYDASP